MKLKIQHFEMKGSGKEHCDDVFYMIHGRKQSIFLLADGVTGRQFGTEGAYKIAEKIGDIIRPSEDRKSWTEEAFKNMVYNTIQKTVAELALARKCDKKEFASTLILVYFPDEEEVWMAHVGDGAIINIGENDKMEVLSYPHYGVLKQYTYTTASGGLYRLIRVNRKKADGWIIGMTDGMMNEIMADMDTMKPEYAIIMKNKDWDTLEKVIKEKLLFDDASFFAVQIENNRYAWHT